MENKNINLDDINLERLSVEELLSMKKKIEGNIEFPNLRDINLDNLNIEPLDIDNKDFVQSVKASSLKDLELPKLKEDDKDFKLPDSIGELNTELDYKGKDFLKSTDYIVKKK